MHGACIDFCMLNFTSDLIIDRPESDVEDESDDEDYGDEVRERIIVSIASRSIVFLVYLIT